MVVLPLCCGRRVRRQARFFPVVLLAFAATSPAFAADRSVAVFDFQLIDTSLEGSMLGKNPDEQARLKELAPAIREDFMALEGYDTVDTASVRQEAQGQNLSSCGGCAVALADEVGADIAFVGTVQKVSNLILNINGYAYDVASGDEIARGSADIRSNTDESWRRGIDFLWSNVLRRQFSAAK